MERDRHKRVDHPHFGYDRRHQPTEVDVTSTFVAVLDTQ